MFFTENGKLKTFLYQHLSPGATAHLHAGADDTIRQFHSRVEAGSIPNHRMAQAGAGPYSNPISQTDATPKMRPRLDYAAWPQKRIGRGPEITAQSRSLPL